MASAAQHDSNQKILFCTLNKETEEIRLCRDGIILQNCLTDVQAFNQFMGSDLQKMMVDLQR